ncbi:YfhD family protein [Anaerobacillus alkalidiazotrophicus]|uniref:YfhD family protein n=1 Tax=Anaerobacillus alkalidiazotrophicus TaxID=472963 RepID=UPI000A7E2441|nr:YfhD family protein [Anaerobacillus alkalidiazotrophicus]
MGRARKQKARDKNKQSLPQTPKKDIATTDDDLEFAKELDDRYQFESQPGFGPLGVNRK